MAKIALLCLSENPVLVGTEAQRLLHHPSRICVLCFSTDKPVSFTARRAILARCVLYPTVCLSVCLCHKPCSVV